MTVNSAAVAADLRIHPLTPERWPDLARLFGDRGACGGCWCMYWRLTRKEFSRAKGEGNREAFRALADAGPPPGLLAYAGDQPVGWCAVAPRQEYPTLGRSRILAPLDDTPVWSITCLFVDRHHRRKGITTRLLRAAAEHAFAAGAPAVEGYPVDPAQPRVPDAFAYTGLASAFRAAGFEEVARRSPTRPIMRLVAE